MKHNKLLYNPAVFAVEDEYQIFIKLKKAALIWIEIDGEKYFDHSNGILRSNVDVHKITVPMELLDDAKKYTVCVRTIKSRKVKFSTTKEVESESFSFAPLSERDTIGIVHLADVHGRDDAALNAVKAIPQKCDLLILNGDIIDNSSSVKNFNIICKLCGEIGKGQIPCIFSRGNHDLRGLAAEKLSDYVPTSSGKSYFTFHLGRVWGIVLDCGEDKPDNHPEYGNTIACEAFRKEETRFLEKVSEESEYNEKEIKHKLVISHYPFTFKDNPPFDIEGGTYKKWCNILGEKIKPDIMLCGHTHFSGVFEKGGFLDAYGQFCPVILGSEIKDRNAPSPKFACAFIQLADEGIKTTFFDKNGETPATPEELYNPQK